MLQTAEIADLAASGNALDLNNLADGLRPHGPRYATVLADTLTARGSGAAGAVESELRPAVACSRWVRDAQRFHRLPLAS